MFGGRAYYSRVRKYDGIYTGRPRLMPLAFESPCRRVKRVKHPLRRKAVILCCGD
jgi:hypothetical protein